MMAGLGFTSDIRRTVCPTCYREVRVTVPARGDGSVDVYYRHNRPGTKELCPESRQTVRTIMHTEED